MAMPSRDFGDLLVADWAQAALFFPEVDEPLFPFVGIYHLHVETFFVVVFPRRIIRVGLSTDLDMPFDRDMCGICEIVGLFFNGSVEHPLVFSDGFEVFLRSPCIGFLWVSSFSPLSHQTMNNVVYGCEGFFAHHMLVIERPSPNERVKLPDQFPSAQRFVCLHNGPYLF